MKSNQQKQEQKQNSEAIIIRGGTIATLGEHNKVLRDHALIIECGKVQKIIPEKELFEGNFLSQEYSEIWSQITILNASGKVVMPGFINAHMHFYSSFARGLIKADPSKNFSEVLTNLWWRLDRKLSAEDNYLSAMVALIDAIKKGTTTLIDHHASPFSAKGSLFEIAKAVKESGLRASLCYELSDRDGEKVAQNGIQENLDFMKWVQSGQEGDQLRALFGMHASFTIEDKTLKSAVEQARALDHKCGFHIHCAEDLSDQEITQKKFGVRVVERLERAGILGPTTICGHAIHLNDHEMDLLRKSDTIVVHNPQSNMNNSVGVANTLKLLEKGILVGLGTDAMTVNMLEELRSAVWVQRLFQKHPNVAFIESYNLLINNNRQIANRFWTNTPLGELKVGAAADVVLIDYDPPTTMDESNFAGHLIFGLAESTVDTTIANGKIVMKSKELLGLDSESIMAHSREVANKLWNRF
ncbi:MAG: putative aminohydrolase SsnA [Oligoflexia bacterium]|nr:putative aminohydrolase SsnA [Oligoflexia bacterium]MBF0366510.1 putative aminohydrolase SsnA [Oligoflexia bacterium]